MPGSAAEKGPICSNRASAKSRRVCKACKSWKTKCDLVQPRCGKCARRKIECCYESVPCETSSSAPATQSPSLSAPPEEVTTGQSTMLTASVNWPLYRGQSFEGGERIAEQRGFSSYLNRVSLPGTVGYWVRDGFFQNAVSMGYEYPFLLHAIVGLGTADHALLTRGRDARLLATAYSYTARSITGQLAAIQSGINASNFGVIFTTATLLAFQTVLDRTFAPVEFTSLAGVADWLRCFRGVHSLIRSAPALFSDSAFASYVVGQPHNTFKGGALQASGKHTFAFTLQGLPRMSTPYKTLTVYRDVVAFLGAVYRCPRRQAHSRFTVEAPTAFVKSVERSEPTALVLMGVYFALTRIMDVPHIYNVSAESEIRLILAHLPSVHKGLLQRAIDLIGDKATRKLAVEDCKDMKEHWVG